MRNDATAHATRCHQTNALLSRATLSHVVRNALKHAKSREALLKQILTKSTHSLGRRPLFLYVDRKERDELLELRDTQVGRGPELHSTVAPANEMVSFRRGSCRLLRRGVV